MENFEVARVDRSEISILRLKGFLDAHTAPNFEQAIQELIEESRYKIIVSMSDLNYISSAGLGVFKVFDLLGFPALYQIFKEETEAEKEYSK